MPFVGGKTPNEGGVYPLSVEKPRIKGVHSKIDPGSGEHTAKLGYLANMHLLLLG